MKHRACHFVCLLATQLGCCQIAYAQVRDLNSNLDFMIGYELVLREARIMPSFVDLDTQRYMSPPKEIYDFTKTPVKSLSEVDYSPELREWIANQGVDVAGFVNGEIVEFQTFDMQTGPRVPSGDDIIKTPAGVITKFTPSQPGEWTRFFPVPRRKYLDPIPFQTREGGVGVLNDSGWKWPWGKWVGPDPLILYYHLARLPPVEGARQIAEPAILTRFSDILFIIADQEALRMTLPGRFGEIFLYDDRVEVSLPGSPKLVASRLVTPYILVDSIEKQILLKPLSNPPVKVRRIGNRVFVWQDGKIGAADYASFSGEEMKAHGIRDWTPE